MERIIKFRFWTPDKIMLEDHEGWVENIGINEALKCSASYYEYKIMQFTGLKDRKGKELWEGDIVQTYMSGRKWLRFQIKYLDNSFVMWRKGDKYKMDCIWYFDYEIIGNIYQNKKLLTNDKE